MAESGGVRGRVEARVHTERVEGARSLVGALKAVAELVGKPMFDWQEWAGDLAMQVDDQGRWLSSVVVCLVARQAGKTWLAALRIVAGLTVLDERLILHSAQNLALAKETFDAVVEMLETTPELSVLVERISLRSGYEAVVMKNGATYKILAGQAKSYRGKAKVDFQLFDEAREQTNFDLWSTSRYVSRVADNPQTWVLSTAGTDESVMLASLCQRGHKAVTDPESDRDICYMEWSAGYDLPIDQPSTWAWSNPTLGVALPVDQVFKELKAEEDNVAGFRREVLSQWVSSLGDPVVSVEAWQACRAELEGFTVGDDVVLAFDLDPEHLRATIVGAGVKHDRLMVAPLAQFSGGVSEEQVADALTDLIQTWRPRKIGYDPKVAAGVADRLNLQSNELEKVTSNDFYSACGRFHDAVKSGRLAHTGDPVLSQDVCSHAVRRYLGDEVWLPGRVNRKRSYVGLAALIRVVWLADQPNNDAWYFY